MVSAIIVARFVHDCTVHISMIRQLVGTPCCPNLGRYMSEARGSKG